MIVLMNVPIPVPSFVLLSAMVGDRFVPQQTPRDVIGELPSLVIVPPLVAVVDEMFVATVVVRVGVTLGGSFLQPIVIVNKANEINAA